MYGNKIIYFYSRLYKFYNSFPQENIQLENKAINDFVKSLGLQLIWYKYFTSTGKRTIERKNFGKFAKDNLSKQPHLSKIRKEYLNLNFVNHYGIDDFVILAERIQ